MAEFNVTVEVRTTTSFTVDAPDQNSAESLAEQEVDKLEFQLVDAESGETVVEVDDIECSVEDVVEA
jgi:hypothetical protein